MLQPVEGGEIAERGQVFRGEVRRLVQRLADIADPSTQTQSTTPTSRYGRKAAHAGKIEADQARGCRGPASGERQGR